VHTVGVCGVVFNASGQVLLVRTAKAGWELPGGRVETGEDLLQALQREVLEETGYMLGGGSVLRGIYCHTNHDTVLLVFRASAGQSGPPETRASPDEDVLETAWFAPHKATRRVTHASEHDRLVDALADTDQVAYRVYR
jgi:8-oxo-dGTP pyrophosphatase MutT (NUDIX family)